MANVARVPADLRWLTFRLKKGQSIGPAKLKDGWAAAAENDDCRVRRETLELAGEAYELYALYAPKNLALPRRAELRMRAFLEGQGLTFTMQMLDGHRPGE